jgi:hypothetical protein
MSLKRMLLTSSALAALIGPATEALAQSYNYNRQFFEGYRTSAGAASRGQPNRSNPVQHSAKPITAKPSAKPAAAQTVHTAKPAPEAAKPAFQVKAAPRPLTDAELAAKTAVDELLAREPALAAAKEKPDPALARAAAAKHDAEERRLAALKAKEEAEAARRQQITEKTKARDDAKAAALKGKHDSHKAADLKKSGRDPEPAKSKPDERKAAIAAAIPVQPIRRMPTP